MIMEVLNRYVHECLSLLICLLRNAIAISCCNFFSLTFSLSHSLSLSLSSNFSCTLSLFSLPSPLNCSASSVSWAPFYSDNTDDNLNSIECIHRLTQSPVLHSIKANFLINIPIRLFPLSLSRLTCTCIDLFHKTPSPSLSFCFSQELLSTLGQF